MQELGHTGVEEVCQAVGITVGLIILLLLIFPPGTPGQIVCLEIGIVLIIRVGRHFRIDWRSQPIAKRDGQGAIRLPGISVSNRQDANTNG